MLSVKPSTEWLLVAAVIVFASTATPLQGQCVVYEDRADMFRLADAVFAGTVRTSEPTGVRGFHIVMHRASFEIDRVWKGEVKRLETIGTVQAFEPGRRYVVFASMSSELKSLGVERSLRTSLECGWAEPESDTGPSLRWLAGKASRTPPKGTD
jgi:hypothetical protein